MLVSFESIDSQFKIVTDIECITLIIESLIQSNDPKEQAPEMSESQAKDHNKYYAYLNNFPFKISKEVYDSLYSIKTDTHVPSHVLTIDKVGKINKLEFLK